MRRRTACPGSGLPSVMTKHGAKKIRAAEHNISLIFWLELSGPLSLQKLCLLSCPHFGYDQPYYGDSTNQS
ncbi:hypothetical protein Desti_4503 [Desulfomonile tiedjei DSM 6799]|uniref:Uncharacterized protein n=1 Tax=Desulfomonile tiedjei (strain ATCC 49306 / DSM 6799 / DCB-1) TaxID=706587 RepID=I4CC43_DESTA|nr:hypothetical protein Desti_4503 [Desulfomonile tiedjei DSM 6799]